MLRTCLFCHQALPANQTLEHFSVGRRVAFDPWRGRLWAVCPSCARWTLAPFEARWEALEELERLTRDSARLLGKSDNIELLRAGDLELVRIGRAGLREESWWRYGDELSARRQRARRVARYGKLRDAGVAFLITGVPIWGFRDDQHHIHRARQLDFGPVAWRGEGRCTGCQLRLERIPFEDASHLSLQPRSGRGVSLHFDCPACRRFAEEGALVLRGTEAQHVLRRVLAHANYGGSSEAGVRSAMDLVESYPSTDRLVHRMAAEGAVLGRLTERDALALEIAVNQDRERQLLEMELGELERQWQEEERIAAIADRL